MSFLVTLTSIHGQSEYRESAHDLHERLRQIGLEWKTADYLHYNEVVLTIRPDDPDKDSTIADLKSALDKIGRIANGD